MKRRINDQCMSFYKGDGETLIASVKINTEKNHCTVVLSGNVNSEVAFEINEEIIALMALRKDVSLDVQNVEYLSATFVEDLIALERKAEKERGKTIVINNMKKSIYEKLSQDGLVYSLDIRTKEELK